MLCRNAIIHEIYGACAFLAGQNTTVVFVSSVNCSDHIENFGAQFDIQAKIVRFSYVNVTGNLAKFCGGIEFRAVDILSFQFNTLTDIKACFLLAFVFLQDSNISHCNLVDNIEYSVYEESGAVLFNRSHRIEVISFHFINCHFTRLVNNLNEDNLGGMIFNKCYSNMIFDDYEDFQVIDCDFNYSDLVSLNLLHLKLGECEGEKSVADCVQEFYKQISRM